MQELPEVFQNVFVSNCSLLDLSSAHTWNQGKFTGGGGPHITMESGLEAARSHLNFAFSAFMMVIFSFLCLTSKSRESFCSPTSCSSASMSMMACLISAISSSLGTG